MITTIKEETYSIEPDKETYSSDSNIIIWVSIIKKNQVIETPKIYTCYFSHAGGILLTMHDPTITLPGQENYSLWISWKEWDSIIHHEDFIFRRESRRQSTFETIIAVINTKIITPPDGPVQIVEFSKINNKWIFTDTNLNEYQTKI